MDSHAFDARGGACCECPQFDGKCIRVRKLHPELDLIDELYDRIAHRRDDAGPPFQPDFRRLET
jgi:hypothetical protein